MTRLNRRALIPLVAVTFATTFRAAQADLEVGTFFGAQWSVVEDRLKNDLTSALASVRKDCAADASCEGDAKTFCGYEHRELLKDHVEGRHWYDPQCEVPHLGRGCFISICMEHCFQGVESLSQQCTLSLREAQMKYELLHQLEKMNDGREISFRFAVYITVLLSVVAGFLVILLRQYESIGPMSQTCICINLISTVILSVLMKEEELRFDSEQFFRWALIITFLLTIVAVILIILLHFHDPSKPMDGFKKRNARLSKRLCIGINWTSVSLLVGFVIALCPMFLLIIVPPFAMVQLAYYICFHQHGPDEAIYKTLERSDPNHLPVAVVSIPLPDV